MNERQLHVLGVLLFIVLLLAPGPANSEFAGSPLSSEAYVLLGGAIFLVVLNLLIPPNRRFCGWVAVTFAVLAILKVVGGLAVAPIGWQGWYYADGDPAALQPFKRGLGTTPYRLDHRIEFDGVRFGLHFLNDPFRYGVPYSRLPRDHEFALKVEWVGYYHLEKGALVTFEARGRGSLMVLVDGTEAFNAGSPNGAAWSVQRELAPGTHQFRLSYMKPGHTDPLVAFAARVDGRELTSAPTHRAAAEVGRALLAGRATTVVIWLAALLLAGSAAWSYIPFTTTLRRVWLMPGRATVVAAFGSVLLLGILFNVIPHRAATVTLYSGDDPLAYEGYARNILFHGLLMPNGAAVGQGVPYYYYPLYSYAIAAVHVVLGEEFSAVIFLNVLTVALVGVLAWYLAWRRLAEWAAGVGAVALATFTVNYLLPYTITAFADSLFICLVFVALLASERALEHDSTGWWIAAGIAGAAAAATRPSFLTHAGVWPLMVVLLGQGLLRRRAWGAAVYCTGFLIGLAPFALRNWIMSGRLVMLVNSWIQIPYFLYPWDVPNQATQVTSLPQALQQALQIVVTEPAMVIETELRKVAFTIGLTQFGPPAVGFKYLLLAGFMFFVLALLRRRLPPSLALVLGAFIVSHLAAMVLATPWTYGYKTILPLHAVSLVGAVYLLNAGAAAQRPGPHLGGEGANRSCGAGTA